MSITPSAVDAVFVTRGDVDLQPVLDSLHAFRRVLVWNNAERENLIIYARYALALETTDISACVYTQDDDCLVSDPAAILDVWHPGRIVCNMPINRRAEYSDGVSLVGYGACYDVALLEPTFAKYLARYPRDIVFLRDCDRIFTGLNAANTELVDVPYTNLAYAEHESRMWRQSDHLYYRQLARQRVAELR